MKVLQICLKPPFPEVDGGCKAMNAFTQGFIDNDIDLKVLTISTVKHPFLKGSMSEEYLQKTNIEHVFVDTKVKVVKALGNLASSKSYNVERFYNKSFEQLIVKTIKEADFDVVLLESLYVSKYVTAIRACSKAKIVFRAHNIESELWKRNATDQKGIKKLYVNSLVKKLVNYEKGSLNSFDGIAAITAKDITLLEQMGCNIPVAVFPFGINIADYQLKENRSGKQVFHIGSMDWTPNQKGIKWFLTNVWNNVIKEFPTAELNLAGRQMPDWIKSKKLSKLNVLGEVDSAIDFINDNNIMVVPLLTGGGMRVKIIEGMALGKIVIATTIAAEGINYTNNKNIVIADSPQEMTAAIVYYLNNTQKQIEIGKQARELMEQDYDNKNIVANLLTFFKKIQA
ncbi:MAG: glycosyltransferase family 4 protein [Flavobacteriales bacterium]